MWQYCFFSGWTVTWNTHTFISCAVWDGMSSNVWENVEHSKYSSNLNKKNSCTFYWFLFLVNLKKKNYWNLPWRFQYVCFFCLFLFVCFLEFPFLEHPFNTLSTFQKVSNVANSWILEVVQIHLCPVVLGLYWSDEGPNGIILHTKKYMKKLFKTTGLEAWWWKDLNYTYVFFFTMHHTVWNMKYHVHNCLNMSAPAGNQDPCVHCTVSNW